MYTHHSGCVCVCVRGGTKINKPSPYSSRTDSRARYWNERSSRQLLSPSLLSLWGSWLIVSTVAPHTAYPSLPFLETFLFLLLILIIPFTKDVFFTTREALATIHRSATRTTSALGSQVEKHGCVTSSNHVASPGFKITPTAGACALGPARARPSGHCWGRCLRRQAT